MMTKAEKKKLKREAEQIKRYDHRWNLAQIGRFQSILHKIITARENPRAVALRYYSGTLPEWRRKALEALREDRAALAPDGEWIEGSRLTMGQSRPVRRRR